jgi:hypothetical protein
MWGNCNITEVATCCSTRGTTLLMLLLGLQFLLRVWRVMVYQRLFLYYLIKARWSGSSSLLKCIGNLRIKLLTAPACKAPGILWLVNEPAVILHCNRHLVHPSFVLIVWLSRIIEHARSYLVVATLIINIECTSDPELCPLICVLSSFWSRSLMET